MQSNKPLNQLMAPFINTYGAYIRLMKVAESSRCSKERRLEAAFMVIEKAMKDGNLE